MSEPISRRYMTAAHPRTTPISDVYDDQLRPSRLDLLGWCSPFIPRQLAFDLQYRYLNKGGYEGRTPSGCRYDLDIPTSIPADGAHVRGSPTHLSPVNLTELTPSRARLASMSP
ncbi:hypothetical protein DACRYDRAFT_21589 [Dacryopinax primogenitus]|uniref:Uncharacterized protein n=1 Tax=Dacryopinax primogenitus (strain DJM 731) TaxID=1858805 RepID=M5FZD0_DACPD|nr:uncharacterized protein DACRYDRAFT_21589 [Dacryopinax primogenitus]EJU03401.1 hypothetical protein DACRYDRAFT_21589 [Dacryopinax primogenitus]